MASDFAQIIDGLAEVEDLPPLRGPRDRGRPRREAHQSSRTQRDLGSIAAVRPPMMPRRCAPRGLTAPCIPFITAIQPVLSRQSHRDGQSHPPACHRLDPRLGHEQHLLCLAGVADGEEAQVPCLAHPAAAGHPGVPQLASGDVEGDGAASIMLQQRRPQVAPRRRAAPQRCSHGDTGDVGVGIDGVK